MQCKHCSSILVAPSSRNGKLGAKMFCDVRCQQAARTESLKNDFRDGKYIGKLISFKTGDWTRNLLITEKSYKCADCGCVDHNGKTIVLEVNHIDGAAKNNVLQNLEFLCPNYHSQTPNFRALNKKSARTNRR